MSLASQQPAFVISPAVGAPGTQVTVQGQGWAPNDDIVARLQDPANPQGPQAEFALATTDADGNFRGTFRIPNHAALEQPACDSGVGIFAEHRRSGGPPTAVRDDRRPASVRPFPAAQDLHRRMP